MVKVRDRKVENKIKSFANNAEDIVSNEQKIQKNTNNKKRKFKRLTFSLTDVEDQLIDNLSLKVRTFRCNRSQVIKTALNLLSTLDDKTICELLEKQKEC